MQKTHRIADFGPSDLLTSDIEGVRRVAVDSQQTSFEQNTQFRFFDRLESVSTGDQIVYRVQTTSPINVLRRDLTVWDGGREYLVYNDTDVTFTGQLLSSGAITPLNENLRPNLASHPVSGVSIQRAIGSNIITVSGSPIAGVAVVAAGNANSATAEYSASEVRFGIDSGRTLWVVMDHIGSNDQTEGQYSLAWEERFGE